MLRSGSVSKIQGLAAEGKPIREIARELGLARNTVRTYLRGRPGAGRRQRGSKLDPYKEQIVAWVRDDHLYNGLTRPAPPCAPSPLILRRCHPPSRLPCGMPRPPVSRGRPAAAVCLASSVPCAERAKH